MVNNWSQNDKQSNMVNNWSQNTNIQKQASHIVGFEIEWLTITHSPASNNVHRQQLITKTKYLLMKMIHWKLVPDCALEPSTDCTYQKLFKQTVKFPMNFTNFLHLVCWLYYEIMYHLSPIIKISLNICTFYNYIARFFQIFCCKIWGHTFVFLFTNILQIFTLFSLSIFTNILFTKLFCRQAERDIVQFVEMQR